MLIVSSETAISGPRKSDGIPSPSAPAATSEQADTAVGPLYDEAPACEFDILLGGFEHGAGDAAPLVDDGVRSLGDDPGAKAHRPRRGRAAASLHAVGIAGHQPDPLRLDPEPFGDDLREARLVALARRHRPQYQLDGARRIDRQLGPLARRTTRKRRRRP